VYEGGGGGGAPEEAEEGVQNFALFWGGERGWSGGERRGKIATLKISNFEAATVRQIAGGPPGWAVVIGRDCAGLPVTSFTGRAVLYYCISQAR
jgi:hypothetical protein